MGIVVVGKKGLKTKSPNLPLFSIVRSTKAIPAPVLTIKQAANEELASISM
jgi:hypothetical protein